MLTYFCRAIAELLCDGTVSYLLFRPGYVISTSPYFEDFEVLYTQYTSIIYLLASNNLGALNKTLLPGSVHVAVSASASHMKAA